MALITDYTFGRITVNGRAYTADLILYPDGRILSPWIRASGHLLTLADLETVIAAKPERIIAGTGAYGRMALATGLTEDLKKMGIDINAVETARAVDLANEARQQGNQRICACVHLTC